MLTYELDTSGGVALYEQLYRRIRADILSGAIQAGEQLPSRRSFAANLGISAITVSGAYAQLESEGYIEARSRSGYYACAVPSIDRIAPTSVPLSEQHLSDAPSYFADFAATSTRAESFPFTVWSRIIRSLLSGDQDALMSPSPAGGVPALRQAIADHLRSFRGMQVDPQQIVVGAGTDYMYALLVQLLGSSCVFAVEDPGYRKAAQVYQSLGAGCLSLPLDERGMRPQLLEEHHIQAVHISPSHHYPTGLVTPAGRRLQLLAWVEASPDHWIIEDDYDSEFRLSGRPVPSMQSMDTAGRVIYLNTFTKTLSSTIRIAYMVLPPALAERFRTLLPYSASTVSNLDQYTLARFISSGSFDKHLNRMRAGYRRQRDLLLDCIRQSAFAQTAEILGEDAGLHFLLRLETGLTDEEICRRCAARGVRMNPLSRFYLTPDSRSRHCFVMNYSSLTPQAVPEAVRAIADALTEAESSHPDDKEVIGHP